MGIGINDSLTSEVLARLDGAVQKIGEKTADGAEYFWPIFVRQQMLEVIPPLIIALVFAAALWVMSKLIRAAINRKSEEACFGLGMATLLIFIAFMFSVAAVAARIPGLFNPEYAAVMDIVGMLK